MTRAKFACERMNIDIVDELKQFFDWDDVGPLTKKFVTSVINAGLENPLFASNGDVLSDLKERDSSIFIRATPPSNPRMLH